MLLQRLTEFTRPSVPGVDDLPPFFQTRPMRWGLRITSDGRLASPHLLDLTDDTAGARGRLGMSGPVPYIARSSGISPMLGADDVQYVLGWADEKVKPKRVADCHTAFVDLVNRWADEAADDPDAQAVRRLYADGAHTDVIEPEEWTSKQGVVFLLGANGHWITEQPSLRDFWAREVERRKAGGSAPGAGRTGMCLVCGRDGVLVDRIPQQIPGRLVPLATQRTAALVSANRRIHTYDFSDSLTTVPICLGCAQLSVANLQYLLDDPDHALSAGGDSRTTWWTVGGPFDFATTLEHPDPARVRVLVERLRAGQRTPDDFVDSARFCSLTIAGNVSRVMVRDWVDMPLAQLQDNIATWFNDHQVLGLESSRDGYLPLVRLELATGRWEAAPGGDRWAGEYARFGAPGAQRPDDVRRQLLRAAMRNVQLSPALFGHLLTRIRTDGHVDDPRAALLRLALVRRARLHDPKERLAVPGPGLDPDNRHPAYLAGRVFAQLETIQYHAARVGKKVEDKLNTTFADRYLAGAIANPKIAIVQGRQLAQPWLKKIRRGDVGKATALDKGLSDLFALFDADAGVPGAGQLDDQAMFILGYHHHRSDSIRRGSEANAAKAASSSSPESASESDASDDPDAA